MSWKLLYSLIICYPYFHLLFHVWLHDGLKHGKREKVYRDLPQREEAAGYVNVTDKLAKIERAQR